MGEELLAVVVGVLFQSERLALETINSTTSEDNSYHLGKRTNASSWVVPETYHPPEYSLLTKRWQRSYMVCYGKMSHLIGKIGMKFYLGIQNKIFREGCNLLKKSQKKNKKMKGLSR